MSKSSELLYRLDEDFIDKFFATFKDIINYKFEDDYELIDVVDQFLQKTYGVSFSLRRFGKQLSARYLPHSYSIKVVAPNNILDPADVFDILITVLHELSHHRAIQSNPVLFKNYKPLDSVDSITSNILQSIERSAYAISVSFEMVNKDFTVSKLVRLANSFRHFDYEMIENELKDWDLDLKNSDIGLIIYVLSKSNKKDRRRQRLLKAITKAYKKVSAYMGRFGPSLVKGVVQ